MEKKLVPELRFPEFSGKWEEKELGKLLEFKNGINASNEQYGKGIKFINVLDILQNNFITYENILGKVDVDDKTIRNYEVNYGDILFQRSSETREEVGKANVYLDEKPATFGGFVIRGKKASNYNPIFLKLALDCSYTRREIMSRSGGSTRYNVSQQILSEAPVMLPLIEEQTKIARLITLINNNIDKQEEKIISLEEYKKAIMQKIFNQEIRFKDKNDDYPEWEGIKLHKILKERKTYAEKEKGIPHASLTINGIKLKTDRYNRDFLVRTDNKKYKISQEGDICYNPANLKFGVITINEIGTVIFSPIYVTFETKAKTNRQYLSYYLMRWNFINKVRRYEEGTVYERMAVKPVDFLKYKINLPALEEQTKIANFLHLLDSKIEKEIQKLDSLRELKKGFMQKMFI